MFPKSVSSPGFSHGGLSSLDSTHSQVNFTFQLLSTLSLSSLPSHKHHFHCLMTGFFHPLSVCVCMLTCVCERQRERERERERYLGISYLLIALQMKIKFLQDSHGFSLLSQLLHIVLCSRLPTRLTVTPAFLVGHVLFCYRAFAHVPTYAKAVFFLNHWPWPSSL
jgi:hypothetical protein